MRALDRFVSFSLFLSVQSTGLAQTFHRLIGTPLSNEYAQCIGSTTDGNFVIGGAMNDSALVVKVDPSGNVLWSRCFKPVSGLNCVVHHLESSPDGFIVGTGNAVSGSDLYGTAFNFKFNLSGNLIWSSYSDDASSVWTHRIHPVSTDQYIMVTELYTMLSPTYPDLFYSKINAGTGLQDWNGPLLNFFPANPYIDDIACSTIGAGGSVYAGGRTYVGGADAGSMRAYIAKFNADGSYAGSKFLMYPNTYEARIYGTDLIYADDSLAGSYTGDISGSSTNYSIGLFRADTLGNMAWSKDYDLLGYTSENSFSVLRMPYGYAITGYATNAGTSDFFVVKLDLAGNVIWAKNYGEPGITENLEKPYTHQSIAVGSDILMVGTRHGPDGTDIILDRIDETGTITCVPSVPIDVATTVVPPYSMTMTPDQHVDNIPFAADPVDASVNTSEVQCQFVDLGPDTGFCDSTTLDATMPDASYTWSDGSHGPTLTVEAAGTYWVAVESPCCSSSDTVDLSAVAPPTAVFGISTSSCDLTISTTNSSLNTDDFSWDFGDGTTSTESQPVHSYNAAGTYVITLTAIGTCSESMDSLTVEVVPPMDVQILGPDTLCTIAQGNYSTTAADSLIVSWLWSTGEPTPECTFGTANSTYLAVTLTTTAGCTMTDSMAIQVTPAPEAGFTFPTASCDTLIMFLDASLHASTWSWNLGNGESSVVPSPSSHYAGSGSYTVTQVVTNACGSDTSVQTLDQGPTGVLTLNGPQSSCQGESATYTIDLQGPDISIAQWIPGIDGLTTINAVMAMDTVIHVYVTGDDGCAYADSISVVVLPLPSASFTATEASCDSTVRFTDNSLHATTWTWDLGNGAWLDEDSLIASYLPGTTSAVSLIVSNFCGSDTMVQMIQLDPFQDLQVNGPARICNDDPISLTLGGMDTDLDEIQWSTGDTAQAITLVPTNGQVITVNALNSHGCALFASYQVVFAGDDGVAPAYIPNVFTPNGDGHNESFIPVIPYGFISMAIYNRWGMPIFETNEPHEPWRGSFNGSPVPDDTYVYQVKWKDACSGFVKETTGNVTLLR